MNDAAKPSSLDRIEQALEWLDLPGVPAEHQPLARAFARTLAAALVEVTRELVAGNVDVEAHAPALDRIGAMQAQLFTVPPPTLGHLFFDVFDWLEELFEGSFDDEGVDVAVGTVDGPAGTPKQVGVGIEILIGTEARPPVPPEPSELPLEFEPPPREPRIRIRVVGTAELDDLLGGLVGGLPALPPTDFAFPLPSSGLDPIEPGIFVGIELRF